MAAMRTAREVVELYNLVVWNEHTLTREHAVNRVKDIWEMFDKLHFDSNIVIAGDDGEHFAIVYDSTTTTKEVLKLTSPASRFSAASRARSPRSGTAATGKGFGIERSGA
jgi:hypothetical protein